MKSEIIKDVNTVLAHLAKYKGFAPATVRKDGMIMVNGKPSRVRVLEGGCTWLRCAISIDASMCRSISGKKLAMELGRTLGSGWRCMAVAVGKSLAVFANGHLVGRVPA